MATQVPSQTSTPRGSASSASKQSELESLRDREAAEQEEITGQDVKAARGLGKNTGNSPHEAGTDQRVEDAKRKNHSKQ